MANALSGEDDLDAVEAGERVRVAVTGAVLAVVAGRRDLLQHLQPPDHRAERGEVRRDLAAVLPAEEELAAVGVGPGVRHGHGAGRVVRPGKVLVIEPVTGRAGPGAGRIPALEHEDHLHGEPVAVGAVEVAALGQEPERVRGARRLGGEHPDRDGALRGVHDRDKGARGLLLGEVRQALEIVERYRLGEAAAGPPWSPLRCAARPHRDACRSGLRGRGVPGRWHRAGRDGASQGGNAEYGGGKGDDLALWHDLDLSAGRWGGSAGRSGGASLGRAAGWVTGTRRLDGRRPPPGSGGRTATWAGWRPPWARAA